MENNCIFCAIASKSVKSYPIYEDERLVAVLDINPATVGHVIVIPKVHYASMYDMPQDQFLYVMTISRAIAYAILLVQQATNVDILYTKELVKGNTTPHAIVHLIPRYENDTVSYSWSQQKPSDEELSALAMRISNSINSVKEGVKPVEAAPVTANPKPVEVNNKPVESTSKSVEVKKEEAPKPIELHTKPVVY